MTPRRFTHRQRPGATLLITVMILGTIALLIGISLALRGIGEMEMSDASYQSQKVLAIADGCMEETMKRLWNAPGFAGGTFSFGEGLCTVTVEESASDMRMIRVEAQTGRMSRTLEAHVDVRSLQMRIRDWHQVR